MSRKNFLFVAAFVLVFVGIGGTYIAKSKAAVGHDCVYRTYSYAPNNYYWCVVQLQSSLQDAYQISSPAVSYPGGADGYYGSNTRTSARTLQIASRTLSPDGVAGPQTWRYTCFVLDTKLEDMTASRSRNYSFEQRLSNDLGNDGCNNIGLDN